MTQAMPRTRRIRLKPEENSFWVARDLDGALWMYDSRPEWNGFDFVLPDGVGGGCARMRDEWFGDLGPGHVVKVGPYGCVADGQASAERDGAGGS